MPASGNQKTKTTYTASYYPARLVWLLSFLALYTTTIMVVIVWWTLVDVRTEQERIDTLKNDLREIHTLFDSRLEKEKWQAAALLDGQTPPDLGDGDGLLALVQRFQATVAGPDHKPLIETLHSQVQRLVGLRKRCQRWARQYSRTLSRFPEVRREVEENLHRLDETVSRAADRHKQRWSAQIERLRHTEGLATDALAQQLIEAMAASPDPTAIIRDIQELTLLYHQMVNETSGDRLRRLKDEGILPVLSRLERELPLFIAVTGAGAPDRLLTNLAIALFGSGYRIDRARQTIYPGGDESLYRLCLARSDHLETQQSLRQELLGLSTSILDTVQQIVAKAEEQIQQQSATGESAIRRALQIILIVGTATAVIFLAISYRVVQEIQGQIQAIEQTNIMLDARTKALTASEEALRRSEEQLQYLSSNLLTAQERERQRIAHELHDELGQAMAALKMQVGAIERHLPDTPPEVLKEKCHAVREFINGIIESVRRLSKDLSPVVINDLGLEAAIDYLASNFAKYHQIPITLDLVEMDSAFSKESQRLIYRIIQEAFTNISKHADAKQIYIAAERHADTMTFVIQDDGRGFDVEATMAKRSTERGMGLATMAERVRILGGRIEFDSTPGRGTTVTFTVPIKPPADEDATPLLDKEETQK